MNISQINPYKDFSSKSTAQKAATIAGTAAAAVAIASVPAAIIKGGKSDVFANAKANANAEGFIQKAGENIKLFGLRLKEGYKAIGTGIADKFHNIFSKKEETTTAVPEGTPAASDVPEA